MKAPHTELSRLVAAAAVSPPFCELLLNKPAEALERGWNRETFDLTPAERQLVFSILAEPPVGKTKTLQEFALRVAQLTAQIDAEADDGP